MLEDEKLSRYIEAHYKNGLKQCGICKKWLDPTMYHSGKKYPDGLQSVCRICKEIQNYRAKFRKMSFDDLVKERERAYRIIETISEVLIEKSK